MTLGEIAVRADLTTDVVCVNVSVCHISHAVGWYDSVGVDLVAVCVSDITCCWVV